MRETNELQFICRRSESVFAAIEKCLDNGLGVCFVVDDDRKLLGRIRIEDLRHALREGKLLATPCLGDFLEKCGTPPEAVESDDWVAPRLDARGRLTSVAVDSSRQFVPIARPDLGHAEFRLALDAFLSSWISSTGPYVQQFQSNFAAFVGRQCGIAVSNCTVALHLALVGLGIQCGDEVILPDLTFAATINAVLHCGATPVIVDVDPITWSLSRETVKPAITSRTKAILPVHLFGRPAAMGPLLDLARAHRLHVIEDCAEAIGARHAGRMVGSFGDVACFSFFANKIITTGEGGMCVTDSPELAARLSELRDHGMAPGRRYWHERVGFNYRMTNPQAAIGVAQLGRLEEILARNRRLEALYREHLGELPGIAFPDSLPGGDDISTWLVCLLVPATQRAELVEAARQANIELRPFFHPLSQMPPYRSFGRDWPTSRGLSLSGLCLPTSHLVDEVVVKRMRDAFWKVLDRRAA